MNVQAELVGLSPPIPTPDSSSHQSPPTFRRRIDRRIDSATCFYCQKLGHWANHCPLKSPNKSKHTSCRPDPAINASQFPPLECQCGHGTCTNPLTSRTPTNPGRMFYKCPLKIGGCNFFKWCDEVTIEDINNPPQIPFPVCDCSAGICHIFTEKNGTNKGRKYFVCQIPKGDGACGFFQWQDTQGKKTTINGHETESKHFSSPASTLKRWANSDLGEDGDCSVKRLKRMECESPVIDNAQHSPNFVDCRELCEQSDISSPEHYNVLQYGSLENAGSFPDFTTGQLVTSQKKSWGSMIEKTPKASLLTTPAGIHQRQTQFLSQISAAEVTSSRDPTYQILGLPVQGWLGRLAFPPPRCLTVPPPKPFFCCVFPSFDFIFVPKDVDVPHSPPSVESDKSGRLSLVNPLPNAQLSSVVLWEPLGLKSPPKVVQDNILNESTLEAFGQAALIIQSNLLDVLESIDPLDRESMVREANSTFVALEGMSVDYRPFYERVREFIGCVYWLAQIEWSIHNDISSKELIDHYDRSQLRFDNLSRSRAEAVAVFAASEERLQLLREEASHVKNLLLQIEDQLSSCEAETMDLETHRNEISEEMLEWELSFVAVSREAEEALKLRQQREVELKEAKAALEKARVQLRQ